MERRTLIILFALLTSLSVSACTASSSPPSVTETPAPIGSFKLPAMTPVPGCMPPCFHGIVPGKTTIAEAFRLVEATSLQTGNQNDGALIWETQRPPREWNTKGVSVENSISFRQGIVNAIRIRPQQDITFQSIVEKYGNPEAVTVGRSGGPSQLVDTVLLYSSKGLAFIGTWLPHLDTRADVYTPHSETLVDSEIYFAPVSPTDLSVDDVNRWRATYVDEIYPWPGFGNLMEPH